MRTSKDNRSFLEQAVAGLAQEGKVICVRLALFAEMMKGKPWTPATLQGSRRHRGRRRHLPRRDLQCRHRPPPSTGYHQKAARAVLKALLPEAGSDIKGHMRSHAELLAASGYASRPREFDDLLRILDGELRLITPTDPEGEETQAPRHGEGSADDGPGERTAPAPTILPADPRLPRSLPAGLADAQAEGDAARPGRTAAGGSGRCLECPPGEPPAAVAAGSGCSIRWLTQQKDWTPPQRKMMRQATATMGCGGWWSAVLVTLVGWGSYEGYHWTQAEKLVAGHCRGRHPRRAAPGRALDPVPAMGESPSAAVHSKTPRKAPKNTCTPAWR